MQNTVEGYMDILVFSDSHGNLRNIQKALDAQIKKPDAILFLGDGLSSFQYLDFDGIPFYSVSGNCDGDFYGSLFSDDERIIELSGKKIMMTHGHKYDVKHTLTRLIYTAAVREVDIVLYGHTHMAHECVLTPDNCEMPKLQKNLYVMNPGAIGSGGSSFGVISISRNGEILLSCGRV